ncbi:uncharacterized protein LOC131936205 [Physella acuta]|uniref:uncharacterized protein LOC131936205 n=1 Tax=Physella acuta TaxID=109671 RepID=UPI0027DB28FE|nr:uncharacterized protein LOC131936205 [Physella acuta]
MSIECKKGSEMMASAAAASNKVYMRILLNRTMDQMTCFCQAKHVLREFRANQTFNVKYRPLCPHNLTVVTVGVSFITFSWTPGFDGGLRQSFIIQDVTRGNILANISDDKTGGVHVVYNITGLPGNTGYTVSVDAENNEGRTLCRQNSINVTTADTY